MIAKIQVYVLGYKACNVLQICYNEEVSYGGDLASTRVAKPEVHAENEISRKTDSLKYKCKR